LKLSVIIPTLNAGKYLPDLLTKLFAQTIHDKEIIIIDSESDDRTIEIARSYNVRVQSVPRKEFNHGQTRNIAARDASGEFLVFLTQDALPVNNSLLENLMSPLEKDPEIAMSYGRQIAYDHSRTLEKFIRGFNYPDKSMTRGKKDIASLGVKTFFCSNACALYRKDIFWDLGGFRNDTIMNEDMDFVYRAVMSGYKVHYAADAQVLHSHDYTLLEQFRRYVDIGVFFANNKNITSSSRNENEGIRYILQASRYLIKNKELNELVYLFLDSFARFLGYRLGLHYRMFSPRTMCRISMNRNYWNVEKAVIRR